MVFFRLIVPCLDVNVVVLQATRSKEPVFLQFRALLQFGPIWR